MPAFRKKPVTVEARQWDGSNESATAIIDWVLSQDGTARYHDDVVHDGERCINCVIYIAIDTLEGTMNVFPDAWVIRGVQGEFYPCKPDIFEATYEPVAAADLPVPEETQ